MCFITTDILSFFSVFDLDTTAAEYSLTPKCTIGTNYQMYKKA